MEYAIFDENFKIFISYYNLICPRSINISLLRWVSLKLAVRKFMYFLAPRDYRYENKSGNSQNSKIYN